MSIVIAAKNEEQQIAGLFAALHEQNYPVEKREIVFVDDQSDDGTLPEARKHSREQVCIATAGPEKPFAGKKGALDIGIRLARYELLVITDADCRPEANWLREIAAAWCQGYTFIYGLAPLTAVPPTPTGQFSVYENMKSWMLMLGAGGLGVHYSATARSLAFSKRFFVTQGGYSAHAGLLSGDDDLLLQQAVAAGERVAIITAAGARVPSPAKTNVRSYLAQKARHVSTSSHYTLRHKTLLGAWHLLSLANRLLLPFALIIPQLWLAVLATAITDFVSEYRFAKRGGFMVSPAGLLLYPYLYQAGVVINFINSLRGKHDWK